MKEIKKGKKTIIYSARDVACEAVQYGMEQKLSLYNRHIQAILYMAQVEWLLSKGYPCFEEDIERWKLGAVVKEIYHTLVIFHTCPIYFMPLEWKTNELSIPNRLKEEISPKPLLEEDKKLVHYLVDIAGKWTTREAIQLFQEQPLWEKYREQIWGEKGDVPSYNQNELIHYYSMNKREWV